MNLHAIDKLLSLVETKNQIDQKSSWSNDSARYFKELKKEIGEVAVELESNRRCYLEDELGDVLWDYLNLLHNLQVEDQISLQNVFARALQKYEERIDAISNGKTWASIKDLQKRRLEQELARENNT